MLAVFLFFHKPYKEYSFWQIKTHCKTFSKTFFSRELVYLDENNVYSYADLTPNTFKLSIIVINLGDCSVFVKLQFVHSLSQ